MDNFVFSVPTAVTVGGVATFNNIRIQNNNVSYSREFQFVLSEPTKSLSLTSNYYPVAFTSSREVPIYRSVGPGVTAARDSGTALNRLTIENSVATFEQALASHTGLGDAIQYDAVGDDGVIDTVVFITARISSTQYVVRTATGAVAPSVTNDQDWGLFRAYTSLQNANIGTENTGLDNAIENFDVFAGGKDISTGTGSNNEWFIMLYGDAIDTTPVVINGWTTASFQRLRIVAPYHTSGADIAQYHYGQWASPNNNYLLQVTNNHGIHITSQHVVLENFRVNQISNGNDYGVFADVGSHSTSLLRMMIRLDPTSTGANNRGLLVDNQSAILSFSTVFGFNNAGDDCVATIDNANVFFMYATLNDCDRAIHSFQDNGGFNGDAYITYTLVQNSASAGIDNSGPNMSPFSGDYNLSDDGADDTPGANSLTSAAVVFRNAGAGDLRIDPADTAANHGGAGVNLMDIELESAINSTRIGSDL